MFMLFKTVGLSLAPLILSFIYYTGDLSFALEAGDTDATFWFDLVRTLPLNC